MTKPLSPHQLARAVCDAADAYAVGGSGKPVYARVRSLHAVVRVINARVRQQQVQVLTIRGDWVEDWVYIRIGSEIVASRIPLLLGEGHA